MTRRVSAAVKELKRPMDIDTTTTLQNMNVKLWIEWRMKFCFSPSKKVNINSFLI